MKRKTVKIEILPAEEQKRLVDREINCSMFVYNHFLLYRFNLWKNEKKNIKFFEELELLEVLIEEEEWLKSVEKESLEQAIRDLDTDYYNFFTQQSKYPKCRKKDDKIRWYKTRNENNNIQINVEEKILKLPCLGFIKINGSELLNDKISYVKVIKIDDKYEALLTYEIQ